MNIHVHYGPGSIHDPEEELRQALRAVEAASNEWRHTREKVADMESDIHITRYALLLERANTNNAALLSGSYLQFALLACIVSLAAGIVFVARLLS
jgi:hypothetical protein